MNADEHGRLGADLLDRARSLQTDAMAQRLDRRTEALALYQGALEHFRAAVAADPHNSKAHLFCGTTLTELGELQAACASFAQAHHLAPSDPDIAAAYAAGLQSVGDVAAAGSVYRAALREHPEHPGLHAGYALTLLGSGDFERGWDEYEWRLKVPQARIERPFPVPRWRGDALEGRNLLVYTEQGVGDEIMFASCFEELAETRGQCVLEASTRLVPLFERSFPKARVLRRDIARMPDWSTLPPIDVCIAAGSVPRFLRRSRGAFPGRPAYLCAEASRVRYWEERLAAAPRPRIGLAWTGGLPQTLRSARSLTLEDLAPLVLGFEATYVALEFLDCTTEVEAFNRCHGERVACWPDARASIDETAALVCALDLVITVTTATAHLAAALGRPTWVLVPSVPSWRYLWAGEEMPWYPSMRVLRGGGSREAVVQAALQRLRQCLPG